MPTETARPFAGELSTDKLRAVIKAYLNTNKTWIVNDFRETVPMDVDYIGKSKGKGKSKSKSKGKNKDKSGSNSKGKSKGKSKDRNQGKGKGKINSKGKGKGKPSNDKECYVCGRRGHLARDCWSRANHDKMVNEVEVEGPNAEPDKEYVYTIEHEVNVVNLSQSGCGVNKRKEKKTARNGTQEPKNKQPGNGTQEPKNKQPENGTQEPMKVW